MLQDTYDKELSSGQDVVLQSQVIEKTQVQTHTEIGAVVIHSNDDEIKALFSALLVKVRKELEARSVDVNDVLQFLVSFFKHNFTDALELDKIFKAASVCGHWSHENYSPLEKLTDRFLPGNQLIESLVRDYKAQLTGFYMTVRLVDYMERQKLVEEVADQEEEESGKEVNQLSPPQRRKVKVVLELKRKVSELSLVYVQKLWRSIAEEYDLPSLTAIVERIVSGSLAITWIVPVHVAQLIRPRAKFFRRHNIILVTVDDTVVYDEEEMADLEKSFLEICRSSATADVDLFSHFLEQGVDPDICDEHGHHPLFYAAYFNREDLVELLIQHHADVDLPMNNDIGETPLITAVDHGHHKVVEILLNHGANVNLRNKKGWSPLSWAAYRGHTAIVLLLLRHHAEVDLPTDDEYGETPLFAACQKGHTEVANVLLQNGAVVNYVRKFGTTPLYVASQGGHTELVSLLLDRGADINKGEASPLYAASGCGHIDTVKLLVHRHASVDKRTDDGQYGGTPLMMACEKNQLEIVKYLTQSGADVNRQTKDQGFSPLHLASTAGHSDIVKFLLQSGALLEMKNKEGRTALMIASWRGHLETAIELLKAGADSGTQDQEGLTSLMLATQNGHTDVVCALLGAKSDPNVTENTVGWSAVFFAAKSGHLEIVKSMIDAGALVDIRDKNGLTPSEVTDDLDIREELKRHSLHQRESVATEESLSQEKQDNTETAPAESEGESPDVVETGEGEEAEDQEKESVEIEIRDEPKVTEEKKRRDLVKESYRRLLRIFDVLEDSLLPGRREKKLHQQREKTHSNIEEANREQPIYND